MLPSTALSRATEQHRESSLQVIRHEMRHGHDSDFLPCHKGPVFKMKSKFKLVEIMEQMPGRQIYCVYLKTNSKNGEEKVINATLNCNSE